MERKESNLDGKGSGQREKGRAGCKLERKRMQTVMPLASLLNLFKLQCLISKWEDNQASTSSTRAERNFL